MTSSPTPQHVPNPNRVAAGRRNRKKRKGLTAAGAAKLRASALKNKPWLKSTGPRTPEGKLRSAANGGGGFRTSVAASITAQMIELHQFMASMVGVRRELAEQLRVQK